MLHIISYSVLIAVIVVLYDVTTRQKNRISSLQTANETTTNELHEEWLQTRRLIHKNDKNEAEIEVLKKQNEVLERAINRIDPTGMHIDFVRTKKTGKQIPVSRINRATIDRALDEVEKVRSSG